jgi:hypothetical protein
VERGRVTGRSWRGRLLRGQVDRARGRIGSSKLSERGARDGQRLSRPRRIRKGRAEGRQHRDAVPAKISHMQHRLRGIGQQRNKLKVALYS